MNFMPTITSNRISHFKLECVYSTLPADASIDVCELLEGAGKSTSSVSAVEEAYNSLNWMHNIACLQSLAGDAIVKSVVEGIT